MARDVPHVIFLQFGETTRQTITVNQLDLLPPTPPHQWVCFKAHVFFVFQVPCFNRKIRFICYFSSYGSVKCVLCTQ